MVLQVRGCQTAQSPEKSPIFNCHEHNDSAYKRKLDQSAKSAVVDLSRIQRFPDYTSALGTSACVVTDVLMFNTIRLLFMNKIHTF